MAVSPARDLGFALHDVARLLRTYSNQRARELGTTRAQWAVLSRLQRCEGAKQNELAEALDLAPITLGRLIDKLTAAGLVERRDDATDRRANRLYLTDKAAARVERPGCARRGLDGPGAGGRRRTGDPRHARQPDDHESQYQERIDCWSGIQSDPTQASFRARSRAGGRFARSAPAGAAVALHTAQGRRSAVDRARIRAANAIGAAGRAADSVHPCADARAGSASAFCAAAFHSAASRAGAARRQAEAPREPVRDARRHSACRARARFQLVVEQRPLCLDRQCLCRRRQVADHAAGHWRDRRRSMSSRGRRSRSAIRCSTSIPSRTRSRSRSRRASAMRPRSNSRT